MHPDRSDGPAARWFADFTYAVHRGLPRGVRRILPQTFIGFALINGSTFLLDLGILALIGRYLPTIPYSLAYSIGFGIASVVAFVLNRWLNFREHGDLGAQGAKYAFVMVSNYVIWIIGFATLLEVLGVPLLVGRVLAACCEGIYIYLMLRLWVFPRGRREADTASQVGLPDPDSVA